ncbi:GNAT family N-acetyltransferase [Halohasta litorea]|uniref:GNAT family N-acetyltransferase n=1 Tax=Halohasta litorea TaxID=869891 RepID=A0ABD6D4P8_9EURY|nr:GNAT family N-acetyltransferase [Halohasta litorea]
MTVLVRIADPTANAVERSKTVADSGIDAAAKRVDGTPTDGAIGSLATIAAIRYAVFVVEQGVDVAIEWDDYETVAEHVLLVDEGRPIGTARVRPTDDQALKCERIAVRASARGAGWGERLMDSCEMIAREHRINECVLHAQQRVAEFYRRQGYVIVSEPFEEAGIPHVKMRLQLDGE